MDIEALKAEKARLEQACQPKNGDICITPNGEARWVVIDGTTGYAVDADGKKQDYSLNSVRGDYQGGFYRPVTSVNDLMRAVERMSWPPREYPIEKIAVIDAQIKQAEEEAARPKIRHGDIIDYMGIGLRLVTKVGDGLYKVTDPKGMVRLGADNVPSHEIEKYIRGGLYKVVGNAFDEVGGE